MAGCGRLKPLALADPILRTGRATAGWRSSTSADRQGYARASHVRIPQARHRRSSGFLLIFLFIWYCGPYFAFGRISPLESATARLIVFGARRRRPGSPSDGEAPAGVPGQRPAARGRRCAAAARSRTRTPAEVLKLRERFEEAVAALKDERRTGHSLYDLPWYVIIGAPGSGKTTALVNSGLKFPIEQRIGKGALRGVGGTRNCDWWFTDEAIFLDTAGRYTTQDSDAASDSAGLERVPALLQASIAPPADQWRDRHRSAPRTCSRRRGRAGGARRGRTQPARRVEPRARIQLPVYLMVTKCDLIAGFAEYFEDLSAGRSRAGLGRHVPVRADAGERRAAACSRPSSTR